MTHREGLRRFNSLVIPGLREAQNPESALGWS
jgi:hypothetical protein